MRPVLTPEAMGRADQRTIGRHTGHGDESRVINLGVDPAKWAVSLQKCPKEPQGENR